jgi:quinol monooxygenase YgiN
MTIIMRAEIYVADSRLDEFREVATQLAAAAGAESGTIQYRWFSSKDPSKFVVIEEYADEDAAFEHNRRCAPLLEQFAQVAELTSVQLHGSLDSDLSKWIDERPQAHAFVPLSD